MTIPAVLESFPGYPAGSVRPLMRPEGIGTSGILCMGESLGEWEEKDELPFRPYAEAGSVLERALFRAGISRESLTLTNLVWYRPPRNWLDGSPWEQEAIRACQPFNDELIDKVRPKVILALGGVAFRELTGMAGEKQGIEMCRGFIVPALQYRSTWSDDGTFLGKTDTTPTVFRSLPVIGTYHPSYLRRGSKERQEAGPKGKTKAAGGGTQGMSLLGVLIRDLQLAQDVAQNGAAQFCYDDYRLGGTISDWTAALEHLRAHPDLPISYDFETQDSLQRESEEDAERTVREVTQVQISWKCGQALVSPWMPDLLPILRQIIELPNPKLDWNGRKFDRPILRDMLIRTDTGEWHDCMDSWHHAQPDLPRGLQFATSFFVPEVRPWKHLSHSQSLYYGALDVDMPQRIFAALRTSLSLIRNPHSSVSLWGDGRYGGYTGQVVRLAPVLDRMTERGIPVDEPHRQALDTQFTTTLQETFSQLQVMIPQEIKGTHVVKKVKDVWEGDPTTLKIKRGKQNVEVPSTWTRISQEEDVKCGCWWSSSARRKNGWEYVTGDNEGFPLPPNCEKCGNTGKVRSTVERWAKVEPFLPSSWQQVLSYIKYRVAEDIKIRISKLLTKMDVDSALAQAQRQTKWSVPEDYKTGKETTGEAELRRLANRTGDLVLPKVLEYREIDKLRGTYVQGWAPGPDGRVHPSFGFRPSTGQLSSENPNAQNMVQHSELAHVMNQMIRARPAYKMVKFDWKSFHAVTAGFEAQDADFIRIARVDIHAFLTLIGILKLERPEIAFHWQSEDLKERLRWWRKQEKLYPAYSRQRHPAGMTFGEIRDELAKRIVYGWEFGQGPRSLYMLNQESFTGEGEADSFQQELRRLFPKVDRWQGVVRLEADVTSFLTTRYGFVRRFYDVYHRKPVADNYQPKGNEKLYVSGRNGQKWLLKPGDDHEAVVAFRPANDAFGIKRERLIQLSENGWDDRYGLISETHDDFRFECPTELLDEMIPNVQKLMEAPSQYLVDPLVAPEGLWCGVEVAAGQDWDSLEKL